MGWMLPGSCDSWSFGGPQNDGSLGYKVDETAENMAIFGICVRFLGCTFQETNVSHQTGKGKSWTQKYRLVGDMLVSRTTQVIL